MVRHRLNQAGQPSPRSKCERGEVLPVVCFALGRVLRSAPVVWHLRREIPWAYRRRSALFSIQIIIAWCTSFLLSRSFLSTVIGAQTIAGVGLGLVVVMILRFCSYQLRLHRQLLATDYRLCPVCLYDLSGLEDQSVCPECGTPYSHDEIRAMWRRSGLIDLRQQCSAAAPDRKR